MKLLSRTNLYYIVISAITYVLVAGSFYMTTKNMVYKEVEARLSVERRDFEHYIQVHGMWDESCYFVENKISITRVSDTLTIFPAYKDTLLFNRYDQQWVPFREYSFFSVFGSMPYKVSIRKSLIESNKLLKFITGTMLFSLSIGLLLLFWFQGKISKKIWQPFYETLSKTKSFEVNEGRGLQLEKQDIYEFNELNVELGCMTDKISRDYKNLQEFTENASHEIQTPLALINSRIEELIQEKDFTRHQMAWIQDIHESTVRLSKLNHALLLLSKIDNGQFYDHVSMHMGRLIETKLADFEEIFNLKGLNVEFSQTREFIVEINAVLADILVSNLINNAVKHNFAGGKIKIEVSNDHLFIQNTGEDPQVDPSGFFERFKKHNTDSGSLGLGLAIVKKICDLYGLNIHYTYTEGIHALYLVRIADV